MSTSAKPAHHTPTSLKDGSRVSLPQKLANPTTSAALALNMSWQLLIVIVLPLLGGYFLDSRYHTSPIWMTVGMALALVAMVVVVRQTVRALNELNGSVDKDDAR